MICDVLYIQIRLTGLLPRRARIGFRSGVKKIIKIINKINNSFITLFFNTVVLETAYYNEFPGKFLLELAMLNL